MARLEVGKCECGCGGDTTPNLKGKRSADSVIVEQYHRFIHGHSARQAKLLTKQQLRGKQYKANLIPGKTNSMRMYRKAGPKKAGQTMKAKAFVKGLNIKQFILKTREILYV